MAAGKPVVGCDSGAVPEIMDYCECGEIYPIKNTKAFADSVMRLLNDPEESERLGQAGQKRVREMFSLEIQRAKMNGIYRELFSL